MDKEKGIRNPSGKTIACMLGYDENTRVDVTKIGDVWILEATYNRNGIKELFYIRAFKDANSLELEDVINLEIAQEMSTLYNYMVWKSNGQGA